MVKASPEHVEGERVLHDQRDLEVKTLDLIQRVRSDLIDQHEWMTSKLDWYNRRYSNVNRRVNEPWPDASNVWLPVSDLYVNLIKTVFMNLLFSGPRVVRMKPVNAAAWENSISADMMMEHILRGGGVNSMPDFEQQMAVGIDHMCWSGLGILHTGYSYKTRTSTETVRRDDMPGVLAKLIVKPEIDESARIEFQDRFPAINTPDIIAMFGEAVNPVNRDVFERHAKTIESLVVRGYGLDLDEKEDQRALKNVMEYLRSGTKERFISLTKKEILEDAPRIWSAPIQDIITPPGALSDFSRLERLTHRLFMTETELKERAEDERFVKEAVDLALEGGQDNSRLHSGSHTDDLSFLQEDRSHRLAGREEEIFEIWKIHHFEDVDGSGLPQIIKTIVEPHSGAVLKKVPLVEDHGQMPYSVISFETNEHALRSPRGVPEILKDIEGHVSAWHRYLENSFQISSTPSFAVARNAVTDPNEIEWFPGLMIPTDDPSRDILPIQMPNNDLKIERLEQFYLQWPERLVGGFDSQAVGERPPERRTATEASIVESQRQRVVSMRGTLFLSQMKRPLNQVWSLFKQFGPRDVFVHVTGEQPTNMTQHQTRGKFAVIPFGAVGAMDPGARQQQALARLQMALQVKPVIDQDPRFEVDIARMFLDWLQAQDPLAAQVSVQRRSPEQIQQAVQEQQAEAQRLAELRDIAERALANAPVSEEEAEMLRSALIREMPHKELQNIISRSQAASQSVQNNSVLAGA